MNWSLARLVSALALFLLASVTRQFTAVAILQLAAEGKLSLDDKLTKLLLLSCQGVFAFAHQVLTTETTTFFGLPARTLLLVGLCGAVGSAVSLLMRLGDFEKMRGASRVSMLMQGFFKPLVGMYCAVFGFALMKSGVVPLQPATPESALYLHMSVCFLLGFSERLAQDLFIRAGEGLTLAGGDRSTVR